MAGRERTFHKIGGKVSGPDAAVGQKLGGDPRNIQRGRKVILDPGIAILYSPDLLHSKSYLFAATLALCQEITIGLAI